MRKTKATIIRVFDTMVVAENARGKYIIWKTIDWNYPVGTIGWVCWDGTGDLPKFKPIT
jgi:hypothetical protein